MRIVFMGTPDFAVGSLQALCESGKHEILAVVTQPDRPKGRGNKLLQTPVKEYALAQGLTVYQPQKVKTPEFVELLHELQPELIVVAAFGQFLSKEILELPKYGCINVHASLLPKYRGAAPIQYAIIKGEKESGVTIMQMNEGVDTGDMLTRVVVPIAPKETAETLFDKLAKAGAELIVETLPRLEAGEIIPVPQDESQASHVKMMGKSLGRIDWNKDAVTIERLVRGLNSWPSAYTYFQEKSVKIWDCDVVENDTTEAPGTIIAVAKDSFDVATGKGTLRIRELQLEGKKRMDTRTFLLGNQWKAGMKFGQAQ
mgnify:CR=1 FL=1